jgi:hypothetical protein
VALGLRLVQLQLLVVQHAVLKLRLVQLRLHAVQLAVLRLRTVQLHVVLLVHQLAVLREPTVRLLAVQQPVAQLAVRRVQAVQLHVVQLAVLKPRLAAHSQCAAMIPARLLS